MNKGCRCVHRTHFYVLIKNLSYDFYHSLDGSGHGLDDYVGFTFFVGCMAMMAASAFFFLSMSSVEGKWKTSLLVSGLIYSHRCRSLFLHARLLGNCRRVSNVLPLRGLTLTVPLMCVEFYLILKAAGAKTGLL